MEKANLVIGRRYNTASGAVTLKDIRGRWAYVESDDSKESTMAFSSILCELVDVTPSGELASLIGMMPNGVPAVPVKAGDVKSPRYTRLENGEIAPQPKNGVFNPNIRAKYERTKCEVSEDGSTFVRTCIDNGDQISITMRPMNIEQVYLFASAMTEIDISTLKAKYSHLNIGMQRMNLGNAVRRCLANKLAE